MNLNDLRSNLVYGLGTLVAGTLIALLILAATSAAYAATITTEQYSFENLETPYNTSTYQYSFSREFIPVERSSLIDNLLRTREGCPKYMSVLEQFLSCSPGQFESGFLTDSDDQNRSTHVEQSS